MAKLSLNEVVAEYGPKTIGVEDTNLGNYPLPAGFRYRKPKGKPYMRNADGSCVIVEKEKRQREGTEAISVPEGGFTSPDVPGWDMERHRMLKVSDFRDEAHYWKWKRDIVAASIIAKCESMMAELSKYTPEERKARANAAREKGRLTGAVEKLAADPAILAGLSQELKDKLLALLSGG